MREFMKKGVVMTDERIKNALYGCATGLATLPAFFRFLNRSIYISFKIFISLCFSASSSS